MTGINLGDGLTGRHFTTFVQVTDPVTGVGKDDFYNNDFAGFVEDSWKVAAESDVESGRALRPAVDPAAAQAEYRDAADYAVHVDDQHRQEQLRAAHRRLRGKSGRDTVVRAGYGIFYAKTTNSTYLRHPRGERRHSSRPSTARPTTCPPLTFPEPDLHASGRDAGGAVRRRADAAGGAFAPARMTADHARPDAGLGESHGARRAKSRWSSELPGNISVSGSTW